MIRTFFLPSVAAIVIGAHCAASHAAAVQHSARIAQILDVTTYLVDVELDEQTTRITLGLSNVAAPKIYGAGCERSAARRAKSFVEDILRPDDQVVVRNLSRRDGRFVGDIEFDGRDLRDILVRFHQVAPPGAAISWCDADAKPTAPTT